MMVSTDVPDGLFEPKPFRAAQEPLIQTRHCEHFPTAVHHGESMILVRLLWRATAVPFPDGSVIQDLDNDQPDSFLSTSAEWTSPSSSIFVVVLHHSQLVS